MLTVAGGIKAVSTAVNVCSNTTDYPEGTLYYDSANQQYCFCNSAGS